MHPRVFFHNTPFSNVSQIKLLMNYTLVNEMIKKAVAATLQKSCSSALHEKCELTVLSKTITQPDFSSQWKENCTEQLKEQCKSTQTHVKSKLHFRHIRGCSSTSYSVCLGPQTRHHRLKLTWTDVWFICILDDEKRQKPAFVMKPTYAPTPPLNQPLSMKLRKHNHDYWAPICCHQIFQLWFIVQVSWFPCAKSLERWAMRHRGKERQACNPIWSQA